MLTSICSILKLFGVLTNQSMTNACVFTLIIYRTFGEDLNSLNIRQLHVNIGTNIKTSQTIRLKAVSMDWSVSSVMGGKSWNIILTTTRRTLVPTNALKLDVQIITLRKNKDTNLLEKWDSLNKYLRLEYSTFQLKNQTRFKDTPNLKLLNLLQLSQISVIKG